jgi:anti-sigma B factor antagonist
MRIEFAHPIERELAHLFDEHGIAWEYEPHTFVLERDEHGNVREGFTPDFFLPEVGMYIECTVMRQSLTGRKRRKAQKARERTGTIVEIAFRRDFDRLARRWGIPALARPSNADVSARRPVGIGTAMNQRAAFEQEARMRLDVQRSGGAAIVIVDGDVDLHSAPELRDRLALLADNGTDHVVVDLSGSTFLDSMALGVLLASKKRIDADGKRLDIVVSTPDVRRIFEITMLDRIFDLYATRAEALGDGHRDRVG